MDPMDTLPPFSGDDTRCAKCGNTKASTRYRADGDRSLGDFFNPTRSERLDRACVRCRYAWSEAITDTGESGLTPDRDVAVAVRALYQLWYWDVDWRADRAFKSRDQILHELYCAALFGETSGQAAARQPEDDAKPEQPGVTIPQVAFDLLLELAQYSRDGGQTTAVGRRALDALAAAGLLPSGAEA